MFNRPKSQTGRSLTRAQKLSRRSALFERLEERSLLSSAPIGSVDIFTPTSISGWAHDADTPSGSVTVRVTIDGVDNNIVTNENRTDLLALFGPGNFGYSFTPNLSPGSHIVTVSAIDTSTNVPVVLKSGTLVNNSPIGSADIISSTRVAGWAFDKDSGSTPIQVRIDNNGVMGTPALANLVRPDLSSLGSTDHAFDVSGTFGVVDVWAIDSPTGTPVLLASNNHTSVGNVEVLTRSTAAGWVFDPDRPTAAVTVRVKVDGVVVAEAPANLQRPDVAGVTGGSTAHGFTLSYSVPTGSHTIQVFAVESDTTSVAETLLGASGSVSNPVPIGAIDLANTGVVSGWAFDADAGAAPVAVQIKVDGVVNTTVTANSPRSDIVSVTGSPNHGFTAPLTGVTVAPHTIEMDVLDNPTGTPVKVATKVIDNTAPIGSIDVANPAVIAGWAYDPDPGSGAVQVIVVLDGTRSPAVAADLNRPDLTSLRETTHGFSIQMPTNLSGAHTVSVIALDTFDNSETVLGTRAFTNHAPTGHVDFVGKIGIAGWVFDPDAPTTSIDVLVFIDNTFSVRATANLARPDVASVTGGSTNHGFSIGFSALSAGSHKIDLYGVDPATGVTTLIGTNTILA